MAMDLEAIQETQTVLKQQEVCNEGDTVKTVGALQDLYGDQHLVIGTANC
jgi:hypothetical protein